jgi:hypothetical protein
MVFCIVTPCCSDSTGRFGGTFLLHLQNQKVSQVKIHISRQRLNFGKKQEFFRNNFEEFILLGQNT